MDAANLLAQLVVIASEGGSLPPPNLPPTGQRGSGGEMEPRIARLEAHMENVRGELVKLATVPVDLAIVKTRVEHLPGKGFVVTAALATVAGVSGLIGLLQHLGILH